MCVCVYIYIYIVRDINDFPYYHFEPCKINFYNLIHVSYTY